MIRRRLDAQPPQRVAPPTDPELEDLIDQLLNPPEDDEDEDDDDETLDAISARHELPEPSRFNEKIIRD